MSSAVSGWENVPHWRDKLNSSHTPLQQSAVWAYVTQMPAAPRGPEDRRAHDIAWNAFRTQALQHSSPAVVDCALYGLAWLVEADRLSLAQAWRHLSQEWPHLPPAVWGTALDLFHQWAIQAAPHPPPTPEADMWVSLARARPDSVGALLTRWESEEAADLWGAPALWARRWAPFFAYLLEQTQESPLAAWRALAWASLRRQLDECAFLEHMPSSSSSSSRVREDEDGHEGGDDGEEEEGEEEALPRMGAAWALLEFLGERVGHLPRQGGDQAYHLECVLSLGAFCQHAWRAGLLSSRLALARVGALWAHLLGGWATLLDRPEMAASHADAGPWLQAAGRMLALWQSVEGWESEALLTSWATTRHVLLVAYLLLPSHEGHQLLALRLLDALLRPALGEQAMGRLFVVPRVVYPLLHVMGAATGRTQALARQLLWRVERMLKAPFPSSWASPVVSPASSGECAWETTGRASGWDHQMACLMDVWAARYAQAVAQGQRVEDALEAQLQREGDTLQEEHLTPFFFFWHAPFLLHGAERVRQAAATLFHQAVNCSAEKSVGLLALVLYQLERETQGALCWQELGLVAALGRYTPLLPTVYRTLHAFLPMASSPSAASSSPAHHSLGMPVAGVGVRLVCRLWQGQDRAFRKLQSAMLSLYEERAQREPEVLLAVALSVRDVCKSRPTRGMEFIALLSSLIQQPNAPLPKSLALQALLHLCRADCVEFGTAWAIIEKDVLHDSHPLVVEQRLRLLPGALEEGPLDVESPTTLQYLHWLEEGTRHAQASVRQAAYEGLEAFFIHESGCITLLSSRAAYARYLEEESAQAGQAAQRVVERVLEEEVGQSRRPLEVTSHAHPLYVQLARQGERMEEIYVEAQRPTLTAGLAGAQLWSYTPTLKKQASSSRGETLLLARAYHLRALELLQDVFLHSWTTRVMGLSAWLRFMSHYFTLRVHADRTKWEEQQQQQQEQQQGKNKLPSSSSSSEDTDHHHHHHHALYGEAMNKMRALLADKRTVSPATSENCVLALVGATLALPPSKHDLIEASVDALQVLWADPENKSNERERGACLVGLACLTHALPLSEFSRVRDIWTLLAHVLEDETGQDDSLRFAAAWGAGLLARALLFKTKGLPLTHAQPALTLCATIRECLQQEATRSSSSSSSSSSHEMSPEKNTKTNSTNTNNNNNKEAMAPLGAALGLGQLASAWREPEELQAMWAWNGDWLTRVQEKPRCVGMSGACLVQAALALRMYRLNGLSPDALRDTMRQMKAWAFPLASAQGNLGACMALGTLIQGALLYGLPGPVSEVEQMMGAYVSVLQAPQMSDSVREACLVGVANALGAGLMIPLDGTLGLLDATEHVEGAWTSQPESAWMGPLVQQLQSLLLEPHHSPRLASSCAWILGALSRPLPSRQATGTSASALLSQLSEDSLLKALLVALEEGGGQSARILQALTHVPPAKLPAWDWTPWVQPFLKGGVGEELQVAAVQFLVHHAANASVSHLLSCLMERADYQALPPALQHVLLAQVPRLLATLPTQRAIRLLHEHALLRQSHWREEWAQPAPNPQTLWWPMLTALLAEPQLASPIRQAALDTLHAFLLALPLPMIVRSQQQEEDQQQQQQQQQQKEQQQQWLDEEWAVDGACSGVYELVSACVGSLGEKLREQCLQVLVEQGGEEGAMKQAIVCSVLVRQQRVPPGRLIASRSVCFTCEEEARGSLVSLWLRDALRGEQTPSVQQRWVQDCLDCARVMPHPRLVLRFLASLVVAWVAPDVEALLGLQGLASGGYEGPAPAVWEGLEWWLPVLLPRLLVRLAMSEPVPATYVAQQRAWWTQQVQELSSSSSSFSSSSSYSTPASRATPSAGWVRTLFSHCLWHLNHTLPDGLVLFMEDQSKSKLKSSSGAPLSAK